MRRPGADGNWPTSPPRLAGRAARENVRGVGIVPWNARIKPQMGGGQEGPPLRGRKLRGTLVPHRATPLGHRAFS